MKKQIFSILLAAIMVFSLLPVTAFAEDETIADILPEDFPTEASAAWVCGNNRNKVIYKNSGYLTIGSYDGENFNKFECSTDSAVTWGDDDSYSYETQDHGTIKFNMADNKLTSIVLESGDYDGTYSPVTIENILPKGFPTSADNAWENSSNDDVCVYKDGSNLTFYNAPVTVLLSRPLTRAERDPDSDFTCTFVYTGEGDEPTIQFNMTGDAGDVLENIVVTRCSVESVEGTYASYTVTYDANGATSGTVPTDTTEYASGASVTVLGNTGTLAKTGYTFDGWNTKADGTGTSYAEGSTFSITADTTLYAKWAATYAITNGTPESAKETNHGYIAIDKETAAEGETVTVTVTPAEGYQLKTLKYNDGTTDHDITKDATTGDYQFTMPSYAVTVTAAFEQPVKLGNLEFTISQNDSIGGDGKSIVYENEYKLSVAYEGMGDNVISTDNGHTELRGIPDGTSVTFTLTVPQGETKVPDLMMSGARETFTDNTFTTNLNFSQNTVTIVSLDFGGDPGPGQEDGHIVKIQINNNDGANGTIQYKFDTDEAFTSKTASDKDDSGNIRIEIPEGATTVTFKAVPDGEFALQDCTILYDDKDIDETKAYMNAVKGDGYEYTLPNDDKTIVFRVDFGDELPTWNTVSWGGGNVEVKNGQVKAYAVHVGDRTYDESVVTADGTNKRYPLSDITKADLQTYGVSYGGTDLFIAEGCADNISIDFRFIPDYGYQVTDVRATEESLLSQFAPGEEISTFHFVYEPETNVHFIVEFTATEDTIDSKGSEIINGASIGNGGNAIDSGNLKMTISDVDETSVSGGLKDEVGENEALYLDLALSQVVSKTGSNGNWETGLTDLADKIDVTLELDPSKIDPMAQYYIIREHETTGGAEYDTISVEYNSAKGTVSFDTDKFSTYALVKDVLLPGEFVVEYDNRGSDKAGISVSVGDPGIIGNGEQRSFTSGSAITFTLTPPEDRTGDTPIVEIQIYDGHDDVPDTVWRSDFDSGNVLAIDNNSFTFTPADDSAFIVRIWWSAYDAFGPAEGQYMIETNILGDGSVRYSPLGAACDRYCEEGIPRKDCYEVGTGVTMTFVPTEGSELFSVVIDDKNGHREYTSEPQEWPTDPLSDILDAGSGNYQIVIADANEGDYFYVEAVFDDAVVPPTPAHHDPDPVINVPLSGDENSIDVKATVSGNTATIQPIKEEEIEKVIGDDAETGTVVIDLSGTNKTITGAKLPTETVEAITEAAAETGNDTAGLELKLSSGTLEFDAKALEAITEAAGDAKNIEIHFDNVGTTRLNADQKAAVSEMVVIEGFEAYVTVDGTRVSDFNGGSVAVYIPYEIPEGNDPAGYTVWFIAEDGTMEKQNATYDGINHRFVVSHFSDYVLTYDETVGQYDNCPKDDTCPMSKFTDADMKAWYHDGVHYCLDNSIMAGFPGDLFKPNGTTTRAQIAQILYNLEGQPAFMNDNIFSDVASGSWYEKAVVWAQGKGVVSGYPDGTFKPDDSITREQLAVILYNYAKYKEIDVTVDENTNFLSFNDFWDTSEWAKPAMMWAIDRELIVGSNWDLKPQGDAVRVQAATIIWKFCETVAK